MEEHRGSSYRLAQNLSTSYNGQSREATRNFYRSHRGTKVESCLLFSSLGHVNICTFYLENALPLFTANSESVYVALIRRNFCDFRSFLVQNDRTN